MARAEPPGPHLAGEGGPVRTCGQGRVDVALGDAPVDQVQGDAAGPVAPLRMISHVVGGEAGVVEEAPGREIGHDGGNRLGGMTVRCQPRGQLPGGKVTAGQALDPGQAGALGSLPRVQGGLCGGRSRLAAAFHARGPAAKAQAEWAWSPPARLPCFAGSSFRRTCSSISRAISGCCCR